MRRCAPAYSSWHLGSLTRARLLFLQELGTVLHRDITALGKAAQHMSRKTMTDARLEKFFDKLRGELEGVSGSQA